MLIRRRPPPQRGADESEVAIDLRGITPGDFHAADEPNEGSRARGGQVAERHASHLCIDVDVHVEALEIEVPHHVGELVEVLVGYDLRIACLRMSEHIGFPFHKKFILKQDCFSLESHTSFDLNPHQHENIAI